MTAPQRIPWRYVWDRKGTYPLRFAGGALVVSYFLLWPVLDIALQHIQRMPQYHFNDFTAYYIASHRFLADVPIYNQQANVGLLADVPMSYSPKYLYPPAYILVFLPFAVLPFHTGAALFAIVSLLVLWTGLQYLLRQYEVALRWWERGMLLWLLMGFQPVVGALKLGQVTVLTAGVLSFGAGLARREQSDAQVPSGIAAAVVATIKPHYAPSGAFLLSNGRRLVSGVVSALGIVVLSAVIVGPRSVVDWANAIAYGKGWGTNPPPITDPYMNFYQPFYLFGEFSLVPKILLILLTVGIILYLVVRRDTEIAVTPLFAVGAALVPLAAPVAYSLEFALVLPAAVALVVSEARLRGGYPVVILVGLLCLNVHALGIRIIFNYLPSYIPGFDALAPIYPLLQPGLWGNLAIFVVALYRLIRCPSRPTRATGRGRSRSLPGSERRY